MFYPQYMTNPAIQANIPQQRLAYLEQQTMPQQSMVNNSNYLKGRPVASVDEARASMIDFDGSVFYFPDLANNRIYTKQINLNGTSSLRMYELSQQAIPTQPVPVASSSEKPEEFVKVANEYFVSKSDFDKVITPLIEEINKLKSISSKEAVPQTKEGKQVANDESNTATAYEF